MVRHSGSRRRFLTAPASALAIGVAGCLDGNPGADDPFLGDPEPFFEIELTTAEDGGTVDPPIVHLVDGGMVEWVIERGVHDTTAYHPETHGSQRRLPTDAEPWASERLTDGDHFDRVFEVEGVYDYVCTRHEERGLVGSIVVGWPEPADEPGLDPPDETYPPAVIDTLDRHNSRVRDVLRDAHG